MHFRRHPRLIRRGYNTVDHCKPATVGVLVKITVSSTWLTSTTCHFCHASSVSSGMTCSWPPMVDKLKFGIDPLVVTATMCVTLLFARSHIVLAVSAQATKHQIDMQAGLCTPDIDSDSKLFGLWQFIFVVVSGASGISSDSTLPNAQRSPRTALISCSHHETSPNRDAVRSRTCRLHYLFRRPLHSKIS